MKTIEESVVVAMDGSDVALVPFLPYILQDVWEIGANPRAIINLIKKHCTDTKELRVLDLGCGKGAVSVNVSRELGCFCYGIDAIPEFVEYARQKAIEHHVSHLCRFETADIRGMVNSFTDYGVVILGAIGPVFGDIFATLSTLKNCINDKGLFIIDDGYIDDSSDFTHPLILKKSELQRQIEKAGMILVEDDIMSSEKIKVDDEVIFDSLKNRCWELIEKYPDKKELFLDYIKRQEIENDVLENKIVGTTMVIRKSVH